MPQKPENHLLEKLIERLQEFGLILRGGFHPLPGDGVPEGTRVVLLIGNAGPALWRRSADALRQEADALDAWTQRVMEPIAKEMGGVVLYPFGGPPYHPFQKWAAKAEGLSPSPLGMSIHPEFGLWHAYRAALCLRDLITAPDAPDFANPCDTCAEKPCLTTCPVAAFSETDGYDVPACAGFLRTRKGEDCVSHGCLARRACPVGRGYIYDPEQAAFHMRAFVRARDES